MNRSNFPSPRAVMGAAWFAVFWCVGIGATAVSIYNLCTGDAVMMPRRQSSGYVMTNARATEPVIYWLSTGAYSLVAIGFGVFAFKRK